MRGRKVVRISFFGHFGLIPKSPDFVNYTYYYAMPCQARHDGKIRLNRKNVTPHSMRGRTVLEFLVRHSALDAESHNKTHTCKNSRLQNKSVITEIKSLKLVVSDRSEMVTFLREHIYYILYSLVKSILSAIKTTTSDFIFNIIISILNRRNI